MWSKAKTGGKAGFDKIYGLVDKLGAPVNKLSNKLGSEAFWPTTLDKESDKAARILRSFCKDGFYEEKLKDTPDGINEKQRVIKKIPAEVIKNAKGLAIFTTMRTGLWFSGAGGSGILVGRLPDGSWSPPSGLMLHTAGLGFLVGVDIYDCVMVINTEEALQAFSKIRATVGGEISAVAGPVGVGGVLDSEMHKRRAPIFTYLKSRGFYAGVQVDGTILIERTDENEKFYGERLSVADILAGKVKHPPAELRTLMQTIKAAQGDVVDPHDLPTEPPPSDFEIENDGHLFGVPDKMDPDPYGVLALEKEGLQIREAGTHNRASHESFIFNPSPSSPLFQTFNRSSIDGNSISRRSSWRTSTFSTTTRTDKSMQTMDMSTQTDFDTPATSPDSRASSGRHIAMREIPEHSNELSATSTGTATQTNGVHEQSKEAESDEEEEFEEPIVHTVQQAATPQFITKARMVSVKKQPPPALPPRNPIRDRKRPLIITGDNDRDNEQMQDQATSPLSRTSTLENAAERTTSIDSMSSVDLHLDAKKDKTDAINAHAHEQEAASVPVAPTASHAEEPKEELKPMPGQFT